MPEENFNKLSEIANNAKKLNEQGETNVSFAEYFPPKFMRKHTSFDDIDKFLAAGKFGVSDFDDINEDKLDKFIKSNSDLEDWEDFKHEAGVDYVARKLGFDD